MAAPVLRLRSSRTEQSPQIQISCDDDLFASENWGVIDLQSYSAPEINCEEQGWTYNFYTEEWELYIRDEES
jgi:hypothetical protein